MKCPKCRYLSFEPELRCKHCGYDFALAEPNLPPRAFDELEQQDPDLPLVDLQLRPADSSDRPSPPLEIRRPRAETAPAFRRGGAAVALADRDVVPLPRPASAPTPLVARRAPVESTPADLPLFMKKGVAALEPARDSAPPAAGIEEDLAVEVPAAPRPLAVRRRAPDSARQTAANPAAAAALPVNRADRDLLEYLRRVETEAAPAVFPFVAASAATGSSRKAPAPADLAPMFSPDGPVAPAARLKAAAADVAVLAALNATVVWLTLRQCDLGIGQVASLPALPLAGFLVTISLSYLLLFSVMGGQTIGKMLFGLRVVGEPASARQLSYRALLTVPSVLLLGLGFLPALLGQGLAIHDRLTHTRVVRA